MPNEKRVEAEWELFDFDITMKVRRNAATATIRGRIDVMLDVRFEGSEIYRNVNPHGCVIRRRESDQEMLDCMYRERRV